MSNSESNIEDKSNSKSSKSKKRSRSVECGTCKAWNRKREMTTHETQSLPRIEGRSSRKSCDQMPVHLGGVSCHREAESAAAKDLAAARGGAYW